MQPLFKSAMKVNYKRKGCTVRNDVKLSSSAQSSMALSELWRDSEQNRKAIGSTSSHIIWLGSMLIRHSHASTVIYRFRDCGTWHTYNISWDAAQVSTTVSTLPTFSTLHDAFYGYWRLRCGPERHWTTNNARHKSATSVDWRSTGRPQCY